MSNKPIPSPDAVSQAYWRRLKEGHLSYQSCRACAECWLPPSPICPKCWGDSVAWRDSAGRARLRTWATYFRAYHPAFVDALPYVVGLVELSEGPRLIAEIRCDHLECLRVGAVLTLELEARENGFLVPVFILDLTVRREEHVD